MAQNSNFDQSSLPNIPGYRVSVDTRQKFHKAHLFDVCNGIPVTDIQRSQLDATPQELDSKIISKTQGAGKENARPSGGRGVGAEERVLPRYVVFDRMVLRYYSYFSENVFNSPIEKERVRRFVIYYFLEDDTVMIDEIRAENSGIPQSTFLKRQRVPSSSGSSSSGSGWLSYTDIAVGGSVSIYKRSFVIVDADKSTRDYLLSTDGVALSAALPYPKDDYIRYLERRALFCEQSALESNDVKSYVEAILGRVSSDRLAASKKYLANDGKVLRFNGVWRDISWGGSVRSYVVLYFLSDDTIQVLEYDRNDKKGEKLIALLKRENLPKKYIPVGCTIGVKHDKSAPNNDYYNHSDLRIGGYLNVYGREVLLTSADKYTQSFYKKVHGLKDADLSEIQQTNGLDAAKELEAQQTRRQVPPYNGYGTEEDSLGSWKSLVPKPPVKDHAKLTKYDGCCLRFLAKLNEAHSQIENHQRRFVIEFFLTDDTLKIYERPLRNSGFIGGKFLERTKVRNQVKDGRPWFHPEDFYVGARAVINGFHFDLLETDKQTTDIMANNIEVFTRDSPERILKALADKLWDRSFNQTKTFRFIDEDKDRYISPTELKSLCAKYGWNVNPNQLKSLFRYFDADDSGEIDATEFFKALHKYKLQKHIYPDKERIDEEREQEAAANRARQQSKVTTKGSS